MDVFKIHYGRFPGKECQILNLKAFSIAADETVIGFHPNIFHLNIFQIQLGKALQKDSLKCKEMTTYVPDYPAVYERLSGMEYLNFIGDVYGVPKTERLQKIEKWLEVFELTQAIGSPIQSYSHGMKQKIVLMAALLPAPQVTVLDEPIVGLDPRASHHMKELMREHCDQGKTLFFSTHIMEVAEKLCDRIGIISKGRLIASGTMEELIKIDESDESLENIFLELTEK